MIPNQKIENFIKSLPEIKAGSYSNYISKTRDIFDALLQTELKIGF